MPARRVPREKVVNLEYHDISMSHKFFIEKKRRDLVITFPYHKVIAMKFTLSNEDKFPKRD